MSTQTEHGRPSYPDTASWRAEAVRRFGPEPLDWRFVCPACSHVASCRDFQTLSVDPARAVRACIGRVHNEQGHPELVYSGPKWVEDMPTGEDDDPGGHWDGPDRGAEGKPCDWAAFGLFGTLGLGTQVVDDEGKAIWVFDFADA